MTVPWYGLLPFVALLAAIATFPLMPATKHLWEKRRFQLLLALVLGVPMGVWVWSLGGRTEVIHALVEYGAFITLLFSLFVVSGGVFVAGRHPGHAPEQHSLPRRGCRSRLADRHDRSRDAPRPAAPEHEPGTEAQGPHGRLHDPRRGELRRPPDAARRPAALPRPPPGRPVPLDAEPLPRVALRERDAARRLLLGRQPRLPRGRDARHRPRRDRGEAPRRSREGEHRPPGRHRRGGRARSVRRSPRDPRGARPVWPPGSRSGRSSC